MRNRTPLINLILNHAHRIQYLELKIFKEALRDLLLSEPIIFKCLEFLSLSSFEDIDHIDSIFFQEAPRLKVAELDIYLELSMTQYLPWGNLEHLSETNSCYLTPFGAHEVIRHCPNIITFQVALPSEEEPTDSILPVTAPYMKMLLVESPQSSEMAKFLRSLVLPYLTRLELRSPDKESIFAAFQNYAPLFLEICRFHQVKNLKIALPIPNPCNLALFLESISYVLNLELPLLSNLTLLLLSSPLVLPKLQTLRVPITPESLDTHLVLLDRRAEGHLNTPGLVLCSSSGNTIELRGCNGNENFYRNLAITELSQNISIKETCSQMRDFVPYHLKPR